MVVPCTFTVNPLASVPPPPFGLVTVTARGPPVAAPSIANDAVSRAEETNVTLLTVIPAPALTVAPRTKPLPSIVTGTVVPVVPWLGVTAPTTPAAVAVATACEEGPSENVAAAVSSVPLRHPGP